VCVWVVRATGGARGGGGGGRSIHTYMRSATCACRAPVRCGVLPRLLRCAARARGAGARARVRAHLWAKRGVEHGSDVIQGAVHDLVAVGQAVHLSQGAVHARARARRHMQPHGPCVAQPCAQPLRRLAGVPAVPQQAHKTQASNTHTHSHAHTATHTATHTRHRTLPLSSFMNMWCPVSRLCVYACVLSPRPWRRGRRGVARRGRSSHTRTQARC
jgi:hypothetical protein